jgi:hypothetical protein
MIMRYILLAAMVFFNTAIFAQSNLSITYIFSKSTVDGKPVMQLTSPEHTLVANKIVKMPDGYFVREFTFDNQPYRWRYQKRKVWTLYKGDSIVADAMKSIRINGVEYAVSQPTAKSVLYSLNGKEVCRALMFREKGKWNVRVDVLQDQAERQETLTAAASYFGLTLIEAKRIGTAGFFIGFPIGFIIGTALTGG